MTTLSHPSLSPSSQTTETSFISIIPTPSFIHFIQTPSTVFISSTQTPSHHSTLHYSSTTLDCNSCLFSNIIHSNHIPHSSFHHIIHEYLLKPSHIPPINHLLSTHSPQFSLSINTSPFYQSITITHRPLFKLPHLS